MKKVIIVHCWEGYPNYCWYPSVKKDLEENGFEVLVPEMPETEAPQMDLWVPILKNIIGSPNEDLILVGHSIGAVTVLRYLETLKEDEKIGGAILVAGFSDDLKFEELANFFPEPLDFEEIKKHCDKFVSINSDDDPFVDLKYGMEFKEKLGAKLIIKNKMGHFSGPVDDEESCTSLPDVTESVLEITN